MRIAQDHRLEPSEVSPESLRQLEELVQDGRHPALLGSSDEHVELPEALYDLLVFVVAAMKRKQAIVLMPEDAALTTQAAAQFLGMSRPYLVRLLDAGQLPCHRVGTHRRILLRDLRAYQAQRDRERRGRLDALGAAVDAAGVYDAV
jgi:excisionase family DNA binding protein